MIFPKPKIVNKMTALDYVLLKIQPGEKKCSKEKLAIQNFPLNNFLINLRTHGKLHICKNNKIRKKTRKSVEGKFCFKTNNIYILLLCKIQILNCRFFTSIFIQELQTLILLYKL